MNSFAVKNPFSIKNLEPLGSLLLTLTPSSFMSLPPLEEGQTPLTPSRLQTEHGPQTPMRSPLCSLIISTISSKQQILNHPRTLTISSKKKILAQENKILCKIPTEEEILNTIKQTPSTKAPRLDGFARLFYKTYWELVKSDLIATIQNFFPSREAPKRDESYKHSPCPKN